MQRKRKIRPAQQAVPMECLGTRLEAVMEMNGTSLLLLPLRNLTLCWNDTKTKMEMKLEVLSLKFNIFKSTHLSVFIMEIKYLDLRSFSILLQVNEVVFMPC